MKKARPCNARALRAGPLTAGAVVLLEATDYFAVGAGEQLAKLLDESRLPS